MLVGRDAELALLEGACAAAELQRRLDAAGRPVDAGLVERVQHEMYQDLARRTASGL